MASKFEPGPSCGKLTWMKLFADEMLGKLARWLRMVGLDVEYRNQLPDEELIKLSQAEQRVILTRDTKLIKILKKGEYLFISHDYLEDQFKQFFEHFPSLKSQLRPLSRCVECNRELQPVDREQIKEKVWPFVYQTQSDFTLCPKCKRIYWRATHVQKIQGRIRRMLDLIQP